MLSAPQISNILLRNLEKRLEVELHEHEKLVKSEKEVGELRKKLQQYEDEQKECMFCGVCFRFGVTHHRPREERELQSRAAETQNGELCIGTKNQKRTGETVSCELREA